MNAECLEQLAALIDSADPEPIELSTWESDSPTCYRLPDGNWFSMNVWRRNAHCGTIGCIAGLAEVLWPQFNSKPTTELEEFLGISADIGGKLFAPKGWIHDKPEFAPQHVARVIRHLIATGQVDWTIP